MDISPVCTAPQEQEISERLQRLQTKMKRQGLDYYLCHDPANIYYLTIFANFVHERPFILLIPDSVRPIFKMPKLEEEHVRIRSVGENPSVAEVSGINVSRTRYLCVTFGGMLMGFAGAIYSLDYNPVWNYNFLMGWGFIALALVFFSMWNPLILMAGSLLFGTLWQLSLNPQLLLPGIMSRYLWRMVPFAITLAVLLLMSTKWFRGRWGAAKPEALGQPYVKES